MIATWAAELMVHRIVALELASPSLSRDALPVPVSVPVTALGGQVNKGSSSRALTPSGQGDSDGHNSKLIASAVSDFKDFLRRYKCVRTSIYLKAHESCAPCTASAFLLYFVLGVPCYNACICVQNALKSPNTLPLCYSR